VVEENIRMRTGIRIENQIKVLVGRRIHAKEASMIHNRRLCRLLVNQAQGMLSTLRAYFVTDFESAKTEALEVFELGDLLSLLLLASFSETGNP
jgi:hypothetical protein